MKFLLEKQIEDKLIEADRVLLENGKSSSIYQMGVDSKKWGIFQFPHRRGRSDDDFDTSQAQGNRKIRRQNKSKKD